MDDDFGGISINLSSNSSSFKPKKKANAQVHGDRAARIKQRKQARFEQKRNDPAPDGGQGQGVKRKSVQEHEEDEPKKRKDEGIISSLFRKNPVIPDVVSSEVTEITDLVFTGKTFKELPLHPYLISNLEEKQGFKEMTEIQRLGIPVIMNGKDSLIKSQTGSGKTLAYAVPIIQALQAKKLKVHRSDGPYALVIVPTRELAIQSYETFVKLLRSFVWIVPGCLMGGEKKKAEKARLRKGVNILVATPGRLLDHMNTTDVLTMRRCQWLVIDEADRLLELGYERDIATIISTLKAQCADPPQTVLLSATLSEGVERLSSVSLTDPQHISVSDGGVYGGVSGPGGDNTPSEKLNTGEGGQTETKADRTFTLPTNLKQQFVVTPCKQRLVTLAGLILWKCQFQTPGSKVIVFMSTQDAVEFHSRLFIHLFSKKPEDPMETNEKLQDLAMGRRNADLDSDDDEEEPILAVWRLHGDMSQKDRTKTFAEFGKATTGVLFCTDVAARGLDLPNVDLIVQYTCPTSTVDYIHRVGRTARAGGRGQAVLFLMPAETGYVQELNNNNISLKQMKPSEVFKPLLEHIDDLPQPTDPDSRRERPHTTEEAATFLQDRFEDTLIHEEELRGLAGKGFQSFVRSYTAYSKDMKEYFRVSQLHLGHLAKSFALREAPGRVSGVACQAKRPDKKDKMRKSKPLSFKAASLSESSSGLDSQRRVNTKAPNRFNKKKLKKLFASS